MPFKISLIILDLESFFDITITKKRRIYFVTRALTGSSIIMTAKPANIDGPIAK